MDQTFRQSMELCRDSADLSLEEMADLQQALQEDPQLQKEFERICGTDQLIRECLLDVEIPTGLQSQVLERLSQEKPSPPKPQNKPQNKFVKRATIAISTVVAACVIAVAVFPHMWGRNNPVELTVHGLQTAAKDSWLRSVKESPKEQWTDATVALPSDIWQKPVRRIRFAVKLDQNNELTADVFQLPAIGQKPLQAYVVAVNLPSHVTVASVPRGPPSTPLLTGGWAIGVWQQGKTLYVLMVEGTLDDYLARLKRAELT